MQHCSELANSVLAGLGSDYAANISSLVSVACRLAGSNAGCYYRLYRDKFEMEGAWNLPPGMELDEMTEGSICRHIMAEEAGGAFVLLRDLGASAFFKADSGVEKYGLRTCLGCRIKLGGAAAGALVLVWGRDCQPAKADTRLLGIIATAIEAEEERRQKQEMLRESESRYRVLYESSRDALMTLFPPDWKFSSGNPAALKLFGAKDEADFISRTLWELSSEYQPGGEPSSSEAGVMIETAMEKRSHFFTWMYKKIDGQEFPATVLLTRFELDGKTGLQATVRDNSAQKREEFEREKLIKQLQQSQKMATLGLLAGGVAHDFNNILGAIMGYAGFVNERLPLDDPNLAEINGILAAAQRAGGLTYQLLAFSRRQKLTPKNVDIYGVMANITKMLRRIIGENIKLKIVPFSAPCLAYVDPGQIEQVIMNLVLNASDAISQSEKGLPREGTITLEAEIIDPPEDFFTRWPHLPKGQLVRLKVSDTGCGMGEEIKKRLFEPFFTTKGQGGTGLGLSIIYGIVKQSRGEIEVESEPGKGSVFSIYLPFVQACVTNTDKNMKLPPDGHETIMVVDDDKHLRRSLKRVLRSSGYTVLAATGGQEAIKLLKRRGRPVDLLLTDVIMPGISGREPAKALTDHNLELAILLLLV